MRLWINWTQGQLSGIKLNSSSRTGLEVPGLDVC